MRSFRVYSPAFVAAFVGVSGAAYAGLSSNMAATCSIGDPAIQNNLYTIASGSVRHQTGKTGVITLYCPIAPTINIGGGSHGRWFMTFVDPDGTANNYYIESQIISLGPIWARECGVGSFVFKFAIDNQLYRTGTQSYL